MAIIPVGLIGVLLTFGGVFFPDPKQSEVVQAKPVITSDGSGYVPHNLRGKAPEPVSSVPVPKPEKVNHPFAGLGLHISAYLHSEQTEKTLYSIAASQNGQRVFRMSDADLVKAGYKLEFLTPCLIKITYDRFSDYLTCDAPRQAVPL